MKSVAIVGFSPLTWESAKDSQADEIWSMNRAYMFGDAKLPLDRLYEIHTREHIFGQSTPSAKEYHAWLRGQKDYPVYMQEAYPDIPGSVAYPLEEIVKEIFPHHRRGNPESYEIDTYFTCTSAMMIAHAIYEGVSSIELYGIEVSSETEYIYQRDGVAYIVGLAEGRGISVYRHKLSKLLRSKIYGYEGYQMITRQSLEKYRYEYAAAMNEWIAKTNVARTAYNQVAKQDDPDMEELKEKFNALDTAIRSSSLYDGALQAIDNLIRECDLQESEELHNRIQTIPAEKEK